MASAANLGWFSPSGLTDDGPITPQEIAYCDLPLKLPSKHKAGFHQPSNRVGSCKKTVSNYIHYRCMADENEPLLVYRYSHISVFLVISFIDLPICALLLIIVAVGIVKRSG